MVEVDWTALENIVERLFLVLERVMSMGVFSESTEGEGCSEITG